MSNGSTEQVPVDDRRPSRTGQGRRARPDQDLIARNQPESEVNGLARIEAESRADVSWWDHTINPAAQALVSEGSVDPGMIIGPGETRQENQDVAVLRTAEKLMRATSGIVMKVRPDIAREWAQRLGQIQHDLRLVDQPRAIPVRHDSTAEHKRANTDVLKQESWDTTSSVTKGEVDKSASAAARNMGNVRYDDTNAWAGLADTEDYPEDDVVEGDHRKMVIVGGRAELVLWNDSANNGDGGWRERGFEVFAANEDGAAAMVEIWHSYYQRHEIRTWEGFVKRYAPDKPKVYAGVLKSALKATKANFDKDSSKFTVPTEGNSEDIQALRQAIVQGLTQASFESGRFFGGMPENDGFLLSDLQGGIARATVANGKRTPESLPIFKEGFVDKFFANVKIFERKRDEAVVQLPALDGTLQYYRWTSGGVTLKDKYTPPATVESGESGLVNWESFA